MIRNRIIRIINTLPNSFSTGELAYYSLTNSFELHIRDKLAFNLQQAIKKSIVLREWNKIDVSVHKNDSSKIGIELKYGFASKLLSRKDITKSGILLSLYKDYRKSKNLLDAWYGVIILSQPMRPITGDLTKIAKKAAAGNKYSEYFDSDRKWRNFIKESISHHFSPGVFQTKVSTLDVGTYKKIPVNLHYAIINEKG